MWMHKLTLFQKTMHKGKVWQSHGHRDETNKENSCRDPFGSMIEPLPYLVVGEVPCCHDSIMTTKLEISHFELI
jgi:hypothetical protein